MLFFCVSSVELSIHSKKYTEVSLSIVMSCILRFDPHERILLHLPLCSITARFAVTYREASFPQNISSGVSQWVSRCFPPCHEINYHLYHPSSSWLVVGSWISLSLDTHKLTCIESSSYKLGSELGKIPFTDTPSIFSRKGS